MEDQMEKRIKQIEKELEEMRGNEGSFSTLLKGILIGGLIGAGFALLSAPRPGFETREIIREKGYEIKEKAIDRADEARAKAEELARIGSSRASDYKQRGQEVINEQRATLAGVVEGIKEGVRTYKEFSPVDQVAMDLPAPRPPQPLMELPEDNPPVPTDVDMASGSLKTKPSS